MAFKCKGDWDSWVGQTFPPRRPENDGRIIIGREEANGKFKGKHRKRREHDLDGTCKETPHHIEFTTTEGFTYSGEITEREFEGRRRDVAEGTRSPAHKDRKRPDEDWVAVKVT